MRLNFDTDWFNNNKCSPSENYLFLNVMVNFVIVNQTFEEKNQSIHHISTGGLNHYSGRFYLFVCDKNMGHIMKTCP